MSPASDVRVLIVADDPLARAGLAALLAVQPGCTAVGQVGHGDDLAAALAAYQPEVLVWDLGWDSAPAVERLAELGGDGPPVVALLPAEAHVADAWAAGARGLLLRDADGASLLAAVVAVSQGLAVLDPALADPVLPDRARGLAPPAGELTPREMEVLRLLAEGMANKAIAGRLGISEHTVKFHVNALLNKLGAQSRTEAVIRATRLGLILI
ncbi:MAG: response regulator transcription factor [Chloroflexi bacterium]|nr:response regulator transcription factor [Chloroflexota bacterium]